MPKVSVCLSTDLIQYQDPITSSSVVIIDILRATSCIVTAFMEGVKEMAVFDDVNACMEMRKRGYLIAAERDGQKVEGFDLGNSPFDYIDAKVKDKKIAITTTNGTKALYASKKAKHIFIGAFLNLDAVVNRLISEQNDVLLFCSGWKGLPNTEDTLFAGIVISKLINQGFVVNGDGAYLSLDFYTQNITRISDVIRESSHALRLSKLTEISKDLDFCSQINVANICPFYDNDKIMIGR